MDRRNPTHLTERSWRVSSWLFASALSLTLAASCVTEVVDNDDEGGSGGATAPKRARLLNPDSTFDNLFSTKHVLFVFCGAFTDLAENDRVTPDDLVEAGLIRELVGRLPVRVRLDALTCVEIEIFRRSPSTRRAPDALVDFHRR